MIGGEVEALMPLIMRGHCFAQEAHSFLIGKLREGLSSGFDQIFNCLGAVICLGVVVGQ